RIQDVFFGRHGFKDGEWLPAEQCQWEPDQRPGAPSAEAADYGCGLRPSLFVARSFHGVYPRAGSFSRFGGVVRDRFDGKGPRWDPAQVVNISLRPETFGPESAWAWYSGC